MTDYPPSSVPKIWPESQGRKLTHEFQLTIEDHILLDCKSGKLLPFPPMGWVAAGLAFFVSLAVYFEFWQRGQIGLFILLVAATVASCLGVSALLIKPARRSLTKFLERKMTSEGHIGRTIYSSIDANGIHGSVNGVRHSCPWNRIQSIEEDEGTFYFWLSNQYACPYPARIFSSKAETNTFREKISEWWGHEITSPPILARMGSKDRARLDDDDAPLDSSVP